MEKGTNAAVFPNAELIVNGFRIQVVDGARSRREIGGRPEGGRQAFTSGTPLSRLSDSAEFVNGKQLSRYHSRSTRR
jgi:hypothetical protein